MTNVAEIGAVDPAHLLLRKPIPKGVFDPLAREIFTLKKQLNAFGIDPLQQYLIEFPDGRIQALSIAWDTRPKEQGGQHWFHLYPNEKIE